MYHFYDTVINDKTGVPLPGVVVRVTDYFGATVDIFADDGGTPIDVVSGIANAAVTDNSGMFDFYVEPGVYTMSFYVGDALLKVLKDIWFGAGGQGSNAVIKEQVATVEGQTDFTLPVTPLVAPFIYLNGTLLSEDDYSYTGVGLVMTAGVKIGGIVTMMVGQPVDQGIVEVGNVIGLGAYVKGILGTREANVQDMSGYDPTGTNDMSASYQALIDQAVVAGVPVVAPGCKLALASTITLPQGHVFHGYNVGKGQQANHALASTFIIGHSGKGFITGSTPAGFGAINIFDQSTRRIQPTVTTGSPWTPSDHDFDYYFDQISDLKMARILMQNATRGIYCNGNRNTIEDIGGQCFKIGFQVDWSYDSLNLGRSHWWPYEYQADEVREYQQVNTTLMKLARVDNPIVVAPFSIWHNRGIEIGYYAGDGTPNRPAGTTYKLRLIGADIDIGDIAYYVTPEANGHSVIFIGCTTQAKNTPSGQPQIFVDAPNCILMGDVMIGNAGGNAIRLTANSTGSLVSMIIRVTEWNQTNSGFPALEVVAGGGHIDALPGSFFRNGNGAAISSGDVTIWTP